MPAIAPSLAKPARVSRSQTWVRSKAMIYRHPTAVIGGVVLVLLISMAQLAPYLGTVDPQAISPVRRLRKPSETYWFGTDMLGRDVYSRVVFGARISLAVGLSVAILATTIGLAIGLITGFVRWLDAVVMRVMDGLMSIPGVLLAIALMALTKASLENVIIAITVTEVPRVVRLIRGLVLSLREQAYVDAASRQRHTHASDPAAPHPTQHAGADARAGHLYLRVCHADRGDFVLSGCRYAAEHPELG